MTWRPSSVSAVTISSDASAVIGRVRSVSSPSRRTATEALASPGPMAAATSPPVIPSGYSCSVPSGSVRTTDTLDS